jgi:hypothetical protein
MTMPERGGSIGNELDNGAGERVEKFYAAGILPA